MLPVEIVVWATTRDETSKNIMTVANAQNRVTIHTRESGFNIFHLPFKEVLIVSSNLFQQAA